MLEARYGVVARTAGMEPITAARHQEFGSALFRDPESLGILWAVGESSAAYTVRDYRRADIRNLLIVLLEEQGSAERRGEERARVLMAGADDVQPDTIDPLELCARLKMLRDRGAYVDHQRIELPGCVYIDALKAIETSTGAVKLSPKVGDLLVALARRPGMTRTKQQLMDDLYGGTKEPDIKIVDVLICKLRQKIMKATGGLDCVQTIWSRGYQFIPEGFVPVISEARKRAVAG
jgi:two-component system cell cycle response regulator CtrA